VAAPVNVFGGGTRPDCWMFMIILNKAFYTLIATPFNNYILLSQVHATNIRNKLENEGVDSQANGGLAKAVDVSTFKSYYKTITQNSFYSLWKGLFYSFGKIIFNNSPAFVRYFIVQPIDLVYCLSVCSVKLPSIKNNILSALKLSIIPNIFLSIAYPSLLKIPFILSKRLKIHAYSPWFILLQFLVALLEIIVTLPIETCKYKLYCQSFSFESIVPLDKCKYHSFYECFWDMFEKGGVGAFYRGFRVRLMGNFLISLLRLFTLGNNS
jgi:hypothetical protein